MNFISLNSENIFQEHICCAFSDKKSIAGVNLKKVWLNDNFSQGLIFHRLDERAKVFIEFMPAEESWHPIEANGYLIINCLWVSGSYKNKGYGKYLIDFYKEQASEYKGVLAITSNKKKPFLNDKNFLTKYGFELIDTAPPYFELIGINFGNPDVMPKFKHNAKINNYECNKGIDVFYTNQCPFTNPYIEIYKSANIDSNIRFHHINTKEIAQNRYSAYTTFSIFKDGKFLTHEILTLEKFKKIIRD